MFLFQKKHPNLLCMTARNDPVARPFACRPCFLGKSSRATVCLSPRLTVKSVVAGWFPCLFPCRDRLVARRLLVTAHCEQCSRGAVSLSVFPCRDHLVARRLLVTAHCEQCSRGTGSLSVFPCRDHLVARRLLVARAYVTCSILLGSANREVLGRTSNIRPYL